MEEKMKGINYFCPRCGQTRLFKERKIADRQTDEDGRTMLSVQFQCSFCVKIIVIETTELAYNKLSSFPL